ncbi:MAG: rhombosortase [Burkholderiales bacterium]|nr:rhombosortase [Burkholderiales bacterium]
MGVGAWALVFALMSMLAQNQSTVQGGWQFVRTAYDAGAWWQLFSAQWVHLGWIHAGANVAGFSVLLLIFRNWVDARWQGLALGGGYVGVAVVLALDTHCAWYAGASGALHGLLAGSLLSLWLNARRCGAQGRALVWLAVAGLLGLLVKLTVQHLRGDTAMQGWLGFASYYPAHEAGAAGGLLVVALAAAAMRWRGPPTHHP